jgi:8-oxo-dGTP pyrophosphatase MutT (NUDIX family)
MDITDWKLINRKLVHANPYFQVYEQDMLRPNGTETNYYVVDRYSPFSIIIPLTLSNETYLVNQYRIPTGKTSWEFPMGGVIGKKPLEIAKQELKEELGMTAKKWEKIGWFYVAHGFTSQKGYVFIARDLAHGEPEPEAGEFLEIKKFPIKQIGTMIQSGMIKDAPTITAYHFFISHRK